MDPSRSGAVVTEGYRQPSTPPGPDVERPHWAPEPALLMELYRAYREHQIRELLALVPRDALRPLYRTAAASSGAGQKAVDDPLALLSDFVDSLLPLPPFRVWCQDVLESPAAHLDEDWMVEVRPGRRAPLLLSTRSERLRGSLWRIELLAYHGGDAWRGHLTFQGEGRGRRYSTADVFREDRLEAVRGRFMEFDRTTLEAFLRSVEP